MSTRQKIKKKNPSYVLIVNPHQKKLEAVVTALGSCSSYMTQPVSYYSASVAITQQKQCMKGRVILAHDLNIQSTMMGHHGNKHERQRPASPSACPRGLVI